MIIPSSVFPRFFSSLSLTHYSSYPWVWLLIPDDQSDLRHNRISNFNCQNFCFSSCKPFSNCETSFSGAKISRKPFSGFVCTYLKSYGPENLRSLNLYSPRAFQQFLNRLSRGTLSFVLLVLSLIHISEPTRRTPISYAVFCLKKKKKRKHYVRH